MAESRLPFSDIPKPGDGGGGTVAAGRRWGGWWRDGGGGTEVRRVEATAAMARVGAGTEAGMVGLMRVAARVVEVRGGGDGGGEGGGAW